MVVMAGGGSVGVVAASLSMLLRVGDGDDD